MKKSPVTSENSEEEGLAEAEANFLEKVVEILTQRVKDLREVGGVVTQEKHHASLLTELQGLPWVLAKSGSCCWIKGDRVPPEVMELVSSRGPRGLKTEGFHYQTTKDGNLLRFEREAQGP